MFEVQQATPGERSEWTVVAGGSRILLVAETDRARLLAHFEAVRAGFAETLDALVADGLSRTPAFALLDTSARPALLAVRGMATATVDESGREREVRASGVSSWVETQLVDPATVSLGASGSGDALPLVEGVVRAVGVVWSTAQDAEDVGATVAAPPRRERDTGPVDAVPDIVAGPAVEAFAPEPEAEAGPEPEAEPEAEADPHTRVPEATFTDVAAASPAEPAKPADQSGYDHLFGATMMRSVEDAAVRPDEEDEAAPPRIALPGFITDSFPPAAGRLEGDHDGLTVMSGDLPERSRPSADEADAAPPAPAPQRFAVLLSDGRREPLSAPVVVGRAPSISAVPSLRGARPVTLTSAEDDISRSHVAVAVEGDSVVVTDLHSRNGTMIVLPGTSPQKLRSGEPTTVVLGTVIDLGSGATLTVEAAG
ncbi:FHA domain-containing protein [Leifsonia sp. 2TAF2]|uniref:FHA domain-containing protein n=1 Tax=Leifsonia sp. 2TAF2 TaxID=3233009 RepID=UPI003F9590CB